MQHEEERFSCAVKRLADLQGVGEKGSKHLLEHVNILGYSVKNHQAGNRSDARGVQPRPGRP